MIMLWVRRGRVPVRGGGGGGKGGALIPGYCCGSTSRFYSGVHSRMQNPTSAVCVWGGGVV